jgi:hypothetical protein
MLQDGVSLCHEPGVPIRSGNLSRLAWDGGPLDTKGYADDSKDVSCQVDRIVTILPFCCDRALLTLNSRASEATNRMSQGLSGQELGGARCISAWIAAVSTFTILFAA